MKFATLICLTSLLIPFAGYCGTASVVVPVVRNTGVSNTGNPIVPLSRHEALTLRNEQKKSFTLMNERGAGCITVWDNDQQRDVRKCDDPTQAGIVLGLGGGVLGALFGGPAGMVVGALVGGVGGYAIVDSEYGD